MGVLAELFALAEIGVNDPPGYPVIARERVNAAAGRSHRPGRDRMELARWERENC